jgi:hypothetical protein
MSSSLLREDEGVDAFAARGSPPHAFQEAATQWSGVRKSRASTGIVVNTLQGWRKKESHGGQVA